MATHEKHLDIVEENVPINDHRIVEPPWRAAHLGSLLQRSSCIRIKYSELSTMDTDHGWITKRRASG